MQVHYSLILIVVVAAATLVVDPNVLNLEMKWYSVKSLVVVVVVSRLNPEFSLRIDVRHSL